MMIMITKKKIQRQIRVMEIIKVYCFVIVISYYLYYASYLYIMILDDIKFLILYIYNNIF